MARADAASASAHPDFIKGLAQSVAKPAYRRLLNAEPLLRRAVPVLIIAFLGHHLRRRLRAGDWTTVGRPSPTKSRHLRQSPTLLPSVCTSRPRRLPIPSNNRIWRSGVCCHPGL